jgi:hypothetical protein
MPSSSSVDEWISSLTPAHAAIARRLRRMVLDVDSTFRESVKWGNPMYSKVRDAVYIADHRQYLHLGFMEGSTLPDPHRLIEGTGKGMRHIKVPELDEELLAKLRGYVRAAAIAASE